MEIVKYLDLKMADDFLNLLFSESISENVEFLEDTFLDMPMHKTLVNYYKDILPKLYSITSDLIKNSPLNVEINEHIIKIFTLASLSVCVLDEMDFLINNKLKKSVYEIELKSILEELKLNGVGNGLVKDLSNIYKAILDMSFGLFKTKKIFDVFSKNNFLETIDIYIKRNSLSINTISNYFSKLFNTISNIYIKTGKLDDIKNKLSQNSGNPYINKVLPVNEFNL